MADADDSMNEDQWLYGDSTNENEQSEQTEKSVQEGESKDNTPEELPTNPFPPEDAEVNF